MTTSTWRRPAAAIAIALTLSSCGGDKADVDTQTERRYCELSRQFEEAAAGAGAAPGPGSFEASPEAARRLLDQMGPTLAEMRSSAPKEVRRDVSTLVEALEGARDGDAEALRSDKVTKATGKINAYRARSCLLPSSSGDG